MSISAYQLGVAQQHLSVSKSDTTNIVSPIRRLYVGTGGNINIADLENNSVIYKNVPSSAVIDMNILRVNETDTTAADFVGLI